jgi:hypothetical protein
LTSLVNSFCTEYFTERNELKEIEDEIEDGYTGFQVIDLKNLGLPEHIYRYFRVSFHDLLKKSGRSGFSLSSYSANDEQQPQIVKH